jgi:bifunctional oligoribonuclease and PAP phosphatase NrnA
VVKRATLRTLWLSACAGSNPVSRIYTLVFKIEIQNSFMIHHFQEDKNGNLKEIWKSLTTAKNVLITLHPRPDGDSLGSSTAMKLVLGRFNVNVKLVSKDRISENLDFYDFSKEVEYGTDIEKVDLNGFDYILFLDHGALEDFYSPSFIEKLKGQKVINLDHHITNSHYGNMSYVNPDAPSTCSVLYDLFKKQGIKFDRELCLRLIIGICTDTSFFIHGNSVDSLKKATDLLETGGINFKTEVFDPVMNSPWKLKKLHGILLSNLEKKEINGKIVAYSWATRKDVESLELNAADLRLGITCMQGIKGVDLAFVLTEFDGEIRGAFRSKDIDTTVYSIFFKGGGHKQASGFRLKTMDLKRAVGKVLEVIKEKGFEYIEMGNSKSPTNTNL